MKRLPQTREKQISRSSRSLSWTVPHFLLFLSFNLFSVLIFAQQKITGKVTAEKTPVAGATVTVKNTTSVTQTNEKGEFSIEAPGDAVLVITSVGFEAQEISVNNRTNLSVEMQTNIKAMEDVVVVGYGTQKKATLTGSVSQVSGREIAKSPSPNVSSSLAGRLPGLTVNQRSGLPGNDDPSILIRGFGTMNDNSPLIIVDGVQRSLFSRLNPQDIESISVLKDASAAIYGNRGANGVILITTKQGARGRTSFDVSYNYAFQRPTKIPKMLDAPTFAEVYNEGNYYRNVSPTNPNPTPFYSADDIQKFRDGSDPITHPNTDWVKEVYKSYSSQQNLNVQASGGTANVRYLFSFGAISQDGNLKNNPTEYSQYNLRTKIDVDITKDLTLGANIYAIFNNRTYSSEGTDGTGVVFVNVLQANPTVVARYPNGLIGPGRLGQNPLLLDQRGFDKIEDRPLYSTFTASYKIPVIKGLKLDASFNYDISNWFEKRFNTPYYFYEYNVNTQTYDRKKADGVAVAELWNTYNRWTTMMYNFRLSYDRTFENHHIAAMIGTEKQKNDSRNLSAYRRNFISNTIPEINFGGTATGEFSNGGGSGASAYDNYFGRINYDFSAKYLLELLFRYDGSQIFPKGNRYAFFPGVSAGWRLSEESFIKDKFSFINQLKLRASYGQLGNDRVAPFQYLQFFNYNSNAYVFGTNTIPGINAATMPNPNITWERAIKTDLGLDATLWNGLLGVEFTYWFQKRSNILWQRNLSISNVFGFSGIPNQNFGKMKGQGYELTLSHRSRAGQLTYDIRANLSYAKSKILDIDETPHTYAYQDATGRPFGSRLLYKSDGIFNTQEELDKYPHNSQNKVGDIKIVDVNGDGMINNDDQIRINETNTPQYVFGLNTNLQYGNFDLTLFFQGQAKVNNLDGTFGSLGASDFTNAAVQRSKDRWTPDNPNGTMPRSDAWSYGATDFFLFDASFVRLKTIEFGYTLPEKVLTKTRLFKGVRVYASGFNLLTWAKEIKWADPELNENFTTYPPQRIINLGVNVKF